MVSESASGDQLRRLWTNLKSRQRSNITLERQYRLATGGGGPCPDAYVDPNIAQIAPALLVEIPTANDSDSTDIPTHPILLDPFLSSFSIIDTAPTTSTTTPTQSYSSTFTQNHPSTSINFINTSTSTPIDPPTPIQTYVTTSAHIHPSTSTSTQIDPPTPIQTYVTTSTHIHPTTSTLVHPSTSTQIDPPTPIQFHRTTSTYIHPATSTLVHSSTSQNHPSTSIHIPPQTHSTELSNNEKILRTQILKQEHLNREHRAKHLHDLTIKHMQEKHTIEIEILQLQKEKLRAELAQINNQCNNS